MTVTLSEDDLRRLLARTESIGAQQYARARADAEAEAKHREVMRMAMAFGEWTLPEADLRALMATGRHHEFCDRSAGYRSCTCGIDALVERDREQADETDALAGYGLV